MTTETPHSDDIDSFTIDYSFLTSAPTDDIQELYSLLRTSTSMWSPTIPDDVEKKNVLRVILRAESSDKASSYFLFSDSTWPMVKNFCERMVVNETR